MNFKWNASFHFKWNAVFSSTLLSHSPPWSSRLKRELTVRALLPVTHSPGSRVTGHCRSGSRGMGRVPGSGRRSWPASVLPPYRPLLPPQASCLHLDISVPSFCLARGHAGTVPAGVCVLLPAASWNCVGLGGTPIPEALDCALASPSYLPQINKSIASECVPYQMNSPIAKYSC